MNKFYVLNNSLDERLYLSDLNHTTTKIDESKKFTSRKLAENFMKKKNLTENYSVKLISSRILNLRESIKDGRKSICDEIESAISDTKDIIDTTLEFLEMYYDEDDPSLNEEIFDGSNIEDVLDRLRKLKKGASGIIFRPSFYSSDGTGMVSDLGKAKDPESSDSIGGDGVEK